MSKRLFPQQEGDRKKAKLDFSISDHNFPLSQNKEPEPSDNWGDDNDDEILLMASQACEEAYNTQDISLLPDYSICMQPGTTSTQMFPSPGPSTSKTEFTFKKPSSNPPSVVSTHLREKCNRISSPLPGITAKVIPKSSEIVNNNDFSDEFRFNDKIYKGQDSDHAYRQLLQLQEENAKLKSENGKLLEKCVTKEGEASILRTQLKSCQISVDNARLEKIKAQEKVQIEWTEKLAAANTHMQDLRTQLDFKNLEIISIKEKCKKLESTKVRLTQVTVANNDITARSNSSFTQNESMTQRRVKTSSNAVQTEGKAHFLALNKISTPETSTLPTLLPDILEPSASPHSLLEYNEKLTHTDTQHKCRVYNTFHRVPANVVKEGKGSLQLSAVYEDIVKIASGSCEWETYYNVFNAAKTILVNILARLETLSQRFTTAFQKEMDEKYIEATSSYIDVSKEDLLKGRALHKEEQEISGRRMIGMLSYVLERPDNVEMFMKFISSESEGKYFTQCVNKICSLLDTTSTATLHSGLLLSLTHTVQTLIGSTPKSSTLETIRYIITSRPMPFVSSQILGLVTDVSLWENFRKEFCPGTSAGNLKIDYDQGVLLYKRDSCYLQILLKEIETCLKSIENQDLLKKAVEITRQLVVLYSNLNCSATSLVQDKSRCDCQLVLVQVTVYALRICAVMLRNNKTVSNASPESEDLLSTCRCGVQVLYQCTLRDVEFGSQLGHNEGHLVEFCEIMRDLEHSEVYANMLTELAGTLQSTPEDMPPSFHRQPWLKSFESFSMVD